MNEVNLEILFPYEDIKITLHTIPETKRCVAAAVRVSSGKDLGGERSHIQVLMEGEYSGYRVDYRALEVLLRKSKEMLGQKMLMQSKEEKVDS